MLSTSNGKRKSCVRCGICDIVTGKDIFASVQKSTTTTHHHHHHHYNNNNNNNEGEGGSGQRHRTARDQPE